MRLTVELACQAPCMLCMCVCEVFAIVLTHLQSMRSCVDSPALLPPPCPWRRPRAGSEGHCKPSTSTFTPTSTTQLSHTLPHTAVSSTHIITHLTEGALHRLFQGPVFSQNVLVYIEQGESSLRLKHFVYILCCYVSKFQWTSCSTVHCSLKLMSLNMFHLYSLFHFTPFFTVFIDFIDMESCVFCLATVVLISRTLRMKRQRVA